MDMKEFERFNNIMDASIDKVVTDHLNKLSDIEYCVTTIQNIIANGGNTKTLLTYATECVSTIKDEIEYFNSIDNIITSNLKELEELKGRNRQLKEINQNALDTYKKIIKEKDNKIEELNEKIGRLTSENNSLSEIKIKYDNLVKLNNESKIKIEEKNSEISELNEKIICLEASLRDSEHSKESVLNRIYSSLEGLSSGIDNINANTNKQDSNISDNSIEEIKNNLTFIKKVLNGEKDKSGNKVPGVIGILNGVNNKLDNNIAKRSDIKDYTNDISRIENKVDSLTESVNKLEDTEKDEKIAELNAAVQMVKDNVNTITYHYKTKEKGRANMHGKEHPRYNKLIDDNELIEDYKSGMILRELSAKYDMSIPGIRSRLIFLGVYKNVYNK